MIVVDTCILSLAFRRRRADDDDPPAATALRQMIRQDWPLAVPGICLQELLSGVRSKKQFRTLQTHLQGLPVLLADEVRHVQAAEIANACREAGVKCSTVDALIAAQTIAADGQLFTTDADFPAMAPCCGLKLFSADRAVQ